MSVPHGRSEGTPPTSGGNERSESGGGFILATPSITQVSEIARSQPDPGAGPAVAGEDLLVILASGPEDGGKRATLALSAACSAAALGRRTRLFLVGDGAHWAYRRDDPAIHVNGFPPLDLLFEELPELGGEITLCSACDAVCTLPEGSRVHRPGVVLGGFAALLAESGRGLSVCF